MSDHSATNSQGVADAASSGVANAQGAGDVETNINESEDGEDGEVEVEVEAQEPETEEVDHEGKKYKIPKDLKPALLFQADYTRKTQDLASTRKQLEESQKAFQERSTTFRTELGKLASVETQLTEYEKLTPQDWQSAYAKDPDGTRAHQFTFDQLRTEKANLTTSLGEKEKQFASEQEAKRQSRAQESIAFLQDPKTGIPGFTPELNGKLKDFAVRELGYAPEEYQDALFNNPKNIKALHRLTLGDAAIKELAALKKAAKSEDVQPLPQVGSHANATTRRTTDSSGDKLSAEAWYRQEQERVRKKNR